MFNLQLQLYIVSFNQETAEQCFISLEKDKYARGSRDWILLYNMFQRTPIVYHGNDRMKTLFMYIIA
jgi:hypothetical protein